MMITGETVSINPALMLIAGAEQQSLAAMLCVQGFIPTAMISFDLVVPADVAVFLIDDLQQHGYGKVVLRFEVLAGAKLTYLMRDVGSFSQGSNASTTSIERSITCTLAGVVQMLMCVAFILAKVIVSLKLKHTKSTRLATLRVM